MSSNNSKSSKGKNESVTWVAAAALAVAAGGLLWAVLSHFIPKAEAPVAAAIGAKPATAPAPTVTATGAGSVAIGNVSGGQVNVGVGAPPAAPSAAASVPGLPNVRKP